MDPTRFDRFAIAVGQRTTRRTAFGLLAALGLTGFVREEAGAVCASPGTTCTRADAALCCSGVCKKKRCRCPQRRCCECDGNLVPCAYVKNHDACTERCRKLTGSIGSFSAKGSPGTSTVLCEDTQCQFVECVPA
jgi:hypothetical protein